MSVTVTECLIVMQEEMRGETSRKQSRLAPIAPKDDQTPSIASSRSARIPVPVVPARVRLPPRSRNGCWTCRTRKVKCNEAKPICGQCARLNHTCDYHPRLSFRDDTPRVVERMADVTVVGSSVWDRICSPANSSNSSIIDDLAPFGTLLTDEDREEKARASIPGTFNVIVNPDSFQHLAEYAGEDFDSKRVETSALRRGSITTSLASSIGRDSMLETLSIPGDPNIVILPRFEDLSRRSTREMKSPTLPILGPRPTIKQEEVDVALPSHSSDLSPLRYFRDVVWKSLVPLEHEPDSSITLFDETATSFPPLVRAMIAVGSLAMFRQDGTEKLDSLQHYSQTLPELQSSLKSEEDLASDGAFLTHFLLLLYEIATADIEHPNIWLHHISSLLKITRLRQQIFRAERFPFIVWWICGIDLDALLSGVGSGEFVTHMMNNDLIPPPSYHLYPLSHDGSSVVYEEEIGTLPTILQLDYEVTLYAIRLGTLASDFRSDVSYDIAGPRQRLMMLRIRQSRVSEIQDGLRHLWTVPAVKDLARADLPPRAQWVFHHAWTLYRACIIYSHTSMWAGQRLDTSPDYDHEITAAALQIIQISHEIVKQSPNTRFLVFPLFMAGFASTNGNHRLLALNLIQRLEAKSIGYNTSGVRMCLQAIYERQNEQFQNTGNSLDVDWLEIKAEKRISVVNFSL